MIDGQQKTRFYKSARTQMLAACSAAAILVVGLGAATQAQQHAPVLVPASNVAAHEASQPAHASTPRMLENSAPFSFADLVERVSPAVVTITSETMSTASDEDGDSGAPDNLPAPFRDLFNQFNKAQPQTPHKEISAGSGFIIDKSGTIRYIDVHKINEYPDEQQILDELAKL